jgi:hypothetical protein
MSPRIRELLARYEFGAPPNRAQLEGAQLIVLNYEIAKAWADTIISASPRALVFDESHHVKEPSAQRTAAIQTIAEAIPDHGLLIAASGTPQVNRPRELIPQLEALRRLNDVGGRDHFLKRYCDMKFDGYHWDDSGSSNELELHERLVATCMVRRRKEDVLDELPPKLPPAGVVVELSNRRAYQRLTKEVVAQLLAEDAGERAYRQALDEGASLDDAERRAELAARRAPRRGAGAGQQAAQAPHCRCRGVSVGKVERTMRVLSAIEMSPSERARYGPPPDWPPGVPRPRRNRR